MVSSSDSNTAPNGAARPFRVNLTAEEIDSLRSRLREARLSPTSILPEDNVRQDRGLFPTPAFLQKYRDMWATSFDFDALQARCNAQPQYLVDIDWCTPMHFIHRPSSRPDAIPLMLIHGWPGNAFEFGHVLDRLAEPGDSSAPAFHVVAPSLPGFLWSKGPPTRKAGTGDVEGYCKILDSLMVDVLGYKSYAAQGGDWGSIHARLLGVKFARADGTGCRAVHLNFCPSPPRGAATLAAIMPEWLTTSLIAWLPDEARKSLLKIKNFSENMAYYWIQQISPSQLGAAVSDSAVGLLAWLGYFYGPTLGRTPTLSEESMLSVCSLYWFTQSIATSFLPYHNNRNLLELHTASQNYLRVPFGYTDFPLEIANTSEGAARRTGDLTFYSRATRGGHFAALEEPEVFVNHLRLAFSPRGKADKASAHEEQQGFVKQATVARGGLWDAERRKSSSRL